MSTQEPPAGETDRRCPSCGWVPDSPDDTRCARCGTHIQPSPTVADSTSGASTPREHAAAPTVAGDPSTSASVRNWGMVAHLSAFLVFVVPVPVIGPLLVWLLKREEHPFVEAHAKEALNFNLSVLIYGVIAGVLILVAIGVLLLPIIFIAWLVLVVIAGVKAANGEDYRYPMTIRFVT